MTDRKKKAIDYLNSRKVTMHWSNVILIAIGACIGTFFLILLLIDLYKYYTK